MEGVFLNSEQTDALRLGAVAKKEEKQDEGRGVFILSLAVRGLFERLRGGVSWRVSRKLGRWDRVVCSAVRIQGEEHRGLFGLAEDCRFVRCVPSIRRSVSSASGAEGCAGESAG